jgi:putative transposase
MINFKGAHFVKVIILTCVRWYLAYPLSYRHLNGMLANDKFCLVRQCQNRKGARTRHWQIRRQFQPTAGGARRWDRVYQSLLQWTTSHEPSALPASSLT